MQVRRCAVVWMEPCEVAHFELEDLLAGGTGVVGRLTWFAHAPHLSAPVEVAAAQVPLLGALGPVDWLERAPLEAQYGSAAIDALLDAGLLIARAADGDAGEHDVREQDVDRQRIDHADAAYRDVRWHPPAAVAHAASRWQGEDGPRAMAEAGVDTSAGLVREQGTPPPHVPAPRSPGADIGLPRIDHDEFDRLLDTRATCRNYDLSATVPLATLSQLLARVFGARGIAHAADGFDVIKRTSPSGGALHPTECYLIVQRVEAVAPGLYHYRIDGHALEVVTPAIAPPQPGDGGTQPLGAAARRAWTTDELRAFARIAVAGQDWFADAPVLCVLAPRFHRSFWKYRNHAKAYRVAILDVGHLSQTLQLCATQAGLGPFITAAINEVDIERAFGLTGYVDGPLAVCGFGVRADTMTTSELDPNRKVWPRPG